MRNALDGLSGMQLHFINSALMQRAERVATKCEVPLDARRRFVCEMLDIAKKIEARQRQLGYTETPSIAWQEAELQKVLGIWPA